MTEHVITTGEDGDRAWWECECGRSGSVPAGDHVEIAAEQHVDDGERVTWRHS